MNLLPRTAVAASAVFFASLPCGLAAQQPRSGRSESRAALPAMPRAAPPASEAGMSPYAGGIAVAVGGLSLVARARRR